MANNSDNIEIFSFWAGYLLGRLHRGFPRRLDLEFERQSFDDRFWPNEQEVEYFYDLFEWLSDNGYISFDQSEQIIGETNPTLYRVGLTERGFRTLQSLPDVLEPNRSIGSRLAEASADVASQASKEALVEGGKSLSLLQASLSVAW